MQHELEALRQSLSSRQAAAAEAARGEYAAALAACHAELEATRAQLRQQALAAARSGDALAAILRTLAVHAGAAHPPAPAAPSEGPSDGGTGGSAAAARAPDPAKAIAFVEAVSGSMLDLQQGWEEERAELAAALEAAEAANEQLGGLLERERRDARSAAGEAAAAAAALRAAEAEAEAARQRLHEASPLICLILSH
jgi:SWI/SNF-related matrix-associated actin-dependent regulator 1 of chromatin subfamily A